MNPRDFYDLVSDLARTLDNIKYHSGGRYTVAADHRFARTVANLVTSVGPALRLAEAEAYAFRNELHEKLKEYLTIKEV